MYNYSVVPVIILDRLIIIFRGWSNYKVNILILLLQAEAARGTET